MHTAEEFQNLLSQEKPHSIDQLPALQEAVVRYPYAATARVLLAMHLHETQSPDFEDALRHAAASTLSRRRLKQLIEGPVKLAFEWHEGETHPEAPAHQPEQDKTEETLQEAFENNFTEEEAAVEVEAPEETVLTEQVPFAGIEEAIAPPKNSFGFTFVKVTRKGTDSPKKDLNQKPFDIASLESKKAAKAKKTSDVIDKFLETQPSISSPRIDFGPQSPQPDLAAGSARLTEEIVTENMAMIYLKQRNYPKALETYQKLQLKFPEKSAYFAALIKNLENTIV